MKKILKGLSLAFVLLTSTQIEAQEFATKNGFSLNVELGKPIGSYGAPSGGNGFEYGLSYGFQIGNRWYLKRFDKSGVALMVNWINYNQTTKTEGAGLSEITAATIDMTFLELGLAYSHLLNDKLALDGYYNLEPTVIGSALVDSQDNGVGIAGVGFGHALGAALRYKFINVGLEYHFGGITGAYSGVGDVSDDEFDLIGDTKLSTSSLKLVFGIKF